MRICMRWYNERYDMKYDMTYGMIYDIWYMVDIWYDMVWYDKFKAENSETFWTLSKFSFFGGYYIYIYIIEYHM